MNVRDLSALFTLSGGFQFGIPLNSNKVTIFPSLFTEFYYVILVCISKLPIAAKETI